MCSLTIHTCIVLFKGAMNFFTSSVNTLINKTMDDTLLTVKHFETARYVLVKFLVRCVPVRFLVHFEEMLG